MLAKAATLPADHVFFDLEDSVTPQRKAEARGYIVTALREHDWSGKTVVIRINGVYTHWCFRDIVEIIGAAGGEVDCVMIPKVEDPGDITFVANLLRMVEEEAELGKQIGIEALIETAKGLRSIHEIVAASPRLEALHFGAADMSASLGLPTVSVGESLPDYPGDQWHWVLETVLVAARAAEIQAIDGPYGYIRNLDGYRESALRGRALGFDGKWALHPGQVDIANEVYTPTQEQYDRALAVLEAYKHSVEVDRRGAALFNDEMIDEATRKMAARLDARGAAAGLRQERTWEDFRRAWEEEG
jgi:citrate lyase subunit beta/citryl-CoA lyase